MKAITKTFRKMVGYAGKAVLFGALIGGVSIGSYATERPVGPTIEKAGFAKVIMDVASVEAMVLAGTVLEFKPEAVQFGKKKGKAEKVEVMKEPTINSNIKAREGAVDYYWFRITGNHAFNSAIPSTDAEFLNYGPAPDESDGCSGGPNLCVGGFTEEQVNTSTEQLNGSQTAVENTIRRGIM